MNDTDDRKGKQNDVGDDSNLGFLVPGVVFATTLFALDWSTGLEVSQARQRFGLFVAENPNTSRNYNGYPKWTFYDVNISSIHQIVESSMTTNTRRIRGHEILTYQNWLSYDPRANMRFGACIHCGKPSDLCAAIQGDVCKFCVHMFILLVLGHTSEETILDLKRKTKEMEECRSMSSDRHETELLAFQDEIKKLNKELKLLYLSIRYYLNERKSVMEGIFQDVRLTSLASSILRVFDRNKIKVSEREKEPTLKLSLSQILRSVERRKREGDGFSGIQLDTLYQIRRIQRTRIDDKEEDLRDSDDNDDDAVIENGTTFKCRPSSLFQELVPTSRLEFESEERKQIEIGFAWVGRPFVNHSTLRFMIDGERRTTYSTSRAPPPKNTIFGHGNDEVLIVEFNESVPLTSLEIDFEIPPIRKNEPVEKMVLHAPQMWSVECFDTEIETGRNNLERVDGGQDAVFPSDWDEIVLRLAPWEISTILGFVNECKDTFETHERIKNVKVSVKRFPLEHMDVIQEHPKMRGYYAELKLWGSRANLKSARDAILNCVCRSNFRKPLMDESISLHGKNTGGGIASMFASKIGKIQYKHPAFDKLKRFGVTSESEQNDMDENLRILQCVQDLFDKKRITSDPSFVLGTSWVVFGESKNNLGLLTFRPTKVTLVARYLDDEGKVRIMRIHCTRSIYYFSCVFLLSSSSYPFSLFFFSLDFVSTLTKL